MSIPDNKFRDFYKTNQSLWDQRTPVHLDSKMYDVQSFLQGRSSLQEIELQAFPEVTGKKLLHLQCHFGQDSLSWARMGAKVTGVDFSEKAIEKAREFNTMLDLDVQFIHCNIYELSQRLEEQFDLVFTSYGVLCWLHDLPAWAGIVERYLRPGGSFFIVEFHPVLYMLDWNTNQLNYPYFFEPEPTEELSEGTYTDYQSNIQHLEYSWSHALSEIMGPLLKLGLKLESFKEYDWSPYNCFPNMQELEEGKYVYGPLKPRLPHLFALKMSKP